MIRFNEICEMQINDYKKCLEENKNNELLCKDKYKKLHMCLSSINLFRHKFI
jgi:hypothetical protein